MKKRGRLKFKKFRIKTWQLIFVLIPLFFLDATLLRWDHGKMTELAAAVIEADKDGNEEELVNSLERLREFVFSNIVINTKEENGVQKIFFGTGPFDLSYSYNRAANAALEEAKKKLSDDINPNGNIYALASNVCSPLAQQNGWAWDDSRFINCMLTEIDKYPAMDEIQDKIIAKLPSPGLYRKNYASPMWAPSLTGFMILITLCIIVVIFIRMIIWIVLRLSLLFI